MLWLTEGRAREASLAWSPTRSCGRAKRAPSRREASRIRQRVMDRLKKPCARGHPALPLLTPFEPERPSRDPSNLFRLGANRLRARRRCCLISQPRASRAAEDREMSGGLCFPCPQGQGTAGTGPGRQPLAPHPARARIGVGLRQIAPAFSTPVSPDRNWGAGRFQIDDAPPRQGVCGRLKPASGKSFTGFKKPPYLKFENP